MFKLGESVRKSFLNYFKQTAICIVTLDVGEDIASLDMTTDNRYRTGFSKNFVVNDTYNKYIHPQIKDLVGVFIRRIRVTTEILDEFINHLAVGMEFNIHNYHQRIRSIDIPNNVIVLDNLYIKGKESTSTNYIFAVLGDLIYTDYFKDLMIKYNLK